MSPCQTYSLHTAALSSNPLLLVSTPSPSPFYIRHVLLQSSGGGLTWEFAGINCHLIQDSKVLTDRKFSELCSVLGVKEQCCLDPDRKVIEKAFRRNALKCHPDKGGDPVAFKKLNDAYYKLIGHITKVIFLHVYFIRQSKFNLLPSYLKTMCNLTKITV